MMALFLVLRIRRDHRSRPTSNFPAQISFIFILIPIGILHLVAATSTPVYRADCSSAW